MGNCITNVYAFVQKKQLGYILSMDRSASNVYVCATTLKYLQYLNVVKGVSLSYWQPGFESL